VTVVTHECEKAIEITNESGLHVIPAQLLCELANHFESEVTIRLGEQTIDAKQLLGLLMLASEKGTVLTVRAVGPDAQDAVSAIETLVESQFDQEVARALSSR
jgi:phosphotransferase system HPr (HPr) family protein